VESPETELNVPNYITGVTVSIDTFTETIMDAYPDIVLEGAVHTWVTEITRTESGRVFELVLGGVLIRGTELRSLFNLRSTAISFEWEVPGSVTFRTIGFGHGVGMSQYGANVMAADGKSYREILLHYYTGASISG
jgi:stage II sporulation protein D